MLFECESNSGLFRLNLRRRRRMFHTLPSGMFKMVWQKCLQQKGYFEMSLIYLLSWWYGKGWGWAISSVLQKLKDINEAFSIPILLRTWFAPWKQIQTQATFRNFFQAAIDNLISRFVGSMVRGSMMLVALLSSLAIFTFAILTALIWPIIPALILIFPLLAVKGGF